MSTTKNVIRTVYLYLFALVGLVLTIVGGVIIVNNLLKTYVFKDAEYNNNNYYVSEPITIDSKFTATINSDLKETKTTIEKIKQKEESATENNKQLTDDQIETLDTWLKDYKNWSDSEKNRQEKESKRDYVKESRDRDMASALSMIIVGFPIYLIHWFIIVRDIKRNKDYGEI
ncbi:MAG: hypothetical protein QMB51_00955 [Patescibacteria group bacterium]